MFLLIAEGPGFFNVLVSPELEGTFWASLGEQFHHHPWDGLRFWDLVQPFFMFIVGVAMPFSFARRWQKGDSWGQTLRHALQRSFLLLLFGWAVYCIQPGELTFELWNVLAQLSFTYLVAFLMLRKSTPAQLVFTLCLIGASEALYRLWPVPGFNQPFVPDHNFGSWVDMMLMGKLSGGHWVAFNAVPTTAHTLWGVLAGKILRSEQSEYRKVLILFIAGLAGIVLGYTLHPVTPIIKRICTSSFVIVSGGWCLVSLAFSYWLIDMMKVQRVPKFFAIVGMNPLFIYLFNETGGHHWIERIIRPFSEGFLAWSGELTVELVTAMTVWLALWGICYWLYRRRIFIKI